jgi:type VI secretion system protein ImpG
MDPRLLRWFKGELQFVQEMGGEFAKEFPKIAGRLGLDGFEVADPYVERLFEGFAFLTARVQLKLDAEFPRFTEAMLECVLPNYLAPVPSAAVVQFWPEMADPGLEAGMLLPRGTVLKSLLGKGDQTATVFRTVEPVTLWPVAVAEAQYVGSKRDLAAFGLPERSDVRAGVRLRLRCQGKASWGKLKLDSLPIWLTGPEDVPMRLYEQLLANTVATVVRPAAQPVPWQETIAGGVSATGFDDEQALLPQEPRAFSGYRLLREYFTFPERFRSVRLEGLQRAAARAGNATELDVFLLLDRPDPRLENNVDASRFALFCACTVNLFEKSCDRIHLDDAENDWHVVPDRSRPLDFEVHTVLDVRGIGTADGVEQEFRPLYGSDDFAKPGSDLRFFTTQRRPRKVPEQQVGAQRSTYVGSELFLTLVDGNAPPHAKDLKQLAVRALCSNRDLPMLMPVGQAKTDFTMEAAAPVQAVRCVAGPTRPRPSLVHGETAWRLINHLSLNHLSLADADPRQGAVALRELLALYADLAERHAQKQIQGVRSVKSQPVVRRLPVPGPLAFGRGLELQLTCEEAQFEGSGTFLLGAVLERFFARYVSINSFTQTVLHTVERGEIARFPARAGNRQLL